MFDQSCLIQFDLWSSLAGKLNETVVRAMNDQMLNGFFNIDTHENEIKHFFNATLRMFA